MATRSKGSEEEHEAVFQATATVTYVISLCIDPGDICSQFS